MVQYRLPLQVAAVESDCRPTIMGGRLVTIAVGRMRYPNGLEHVEEKREEIVLQSRAAMVWCGVVVWLLGDGWIIESPSVDD